MTRLSRRIWTAVRRLLGAPPRRFHSELRRALQEQQPVGLRAGTLVRALEHGNGSARSSVEAGDAAN